MKKIVTHRKFFVGLGGALGFLGCWGIALWTGQSYDECFFKGAIGAFVGGWIGKQLADAFVRLSEASVKERPIAADKNI